MTEAFKPIAIGPPSENRLLFAVRRMVDLQLLTTFSFLSVELTELRGRVLDVGAGQAPWRELLRNAEYVGLDVEAASEFGMKRQPDVVYYDGGRMPFPDSSFDHVMCSEVLEHVPDPVFFMAEVSRLLRAGGTLVLTVPWSARLHHLPHDYFRFTRYALVALMNRSGFGVLRVRERGNDITVVANKIIVMTIRLCRPARWRSVWWSWPGALLMTPITIAFLIAAHLSLWFGWGSREDPLGYGLVAVKS